MVELLKRPTTVGSATDALLEILHQRVPKAPGKEAGLDANVAWVAATYPAIDLDSPPHTSCLRQHRRCLVSDPGTAPGLRYLCFNSVR